METSIQICEQNEDSQNSVHIQELLGETCYKSRLTISYHRNSDMVGLNFGGFYFVYNAYNIINHIL